MQNKSACEQGFELNVEHDTDIHGQKHSVSEMCKILPEHMRVRYKDSIFWNEGTVADCETRGVLDKAVLNVVPISSCAE